MRARHRSGTPREAGPLCYASGSFAIVFSAPMIELNPIRQHIADLQDRLVSLRGYL